MSARRKQKRVDAKAEVEQRTSKRAKLCSTPIIIPRSPIEEEQENEETEFRKEEAEVEREWHLYLSNLCFHRFDWEIAKELNHKLHKLWLNIQLIAELVDLVREQRSWFCFHLSTETQKSLEKWLGSRLQPGECYPGRGCDPHVVILAALKRVYGTPAHFLESIQKDPSFIFEVTPFLLLHWKPSYLDSAMSLTQFAERRDAIFSRMGVKATYHDRFTPQAPFVEILHTSLLKCPLSTMLERLTTLKEEAREAESKSRLHLWADDDPIIAVTKVAAREYGRPRLLPMKNQSPC